MLVISHKSSDEFISFLDRLGYKYIFTIDNSNLDPRIADHPDLSLFVLDEENIVVDRTLAPYYKKLLPAKNIIAGDVVASKYPYDSIYNIYKGSDFYFHNDFTESNIENYLKINDYKHFKIKQGYSRCSIIPMEDKILTSDLGIYKSLKDTIDVTLLANDYIRLDGFDTGFIGGTCGLVGDTLIFNGDISKHSSFDIIKTEADKAGIELVYPSCELIDTGSIINVY